LQSVRLAEFHHLSGVATCSAAPLREGLRQSRLTALGAAMLAPVGRSRVSVACLPLRGAALAGTGPAAWAACLGWCPVLSLPVVARASLLAAQRWPAGAVARRANARPGAAVAAWKAALQVPCLACHHLIFARTGWLD
jgi:hypothetical protein